MRAAGMTSQSCHKSLPALAKIMGSYFLRSTGPLAEKSTPLFGEPRAWIEDQFRADGHGDDSRGFAIHLLSALQGISVLAHGSREPELVVMETRRVQDWIRAL